MVQRNLLLYTKFCIKNRLIENIPEINKDIENVVFGTMDTWIIWNLTGNYVTDVTNASRTFLMNLKTLDWDQQLLDEFKISRQNLPKILSCCEDFGTIKVKCALEGLSITGSIGDQQAASIGHGIFNVGNVKNTYGTGVFLMINTGEEVLDIPGLITTVCYQLGKENKTIYALEVMKMTI